MITTFEFLQVMREERDRIRKCIGVQKEFIKLAEEMAELTKDIARSLYEKRTIDDTVFEELADVLVVIGVILSDERIDNVVRIIAQDKLHRSKMRMEEGTL